MDSDSEITFENQLLESFKSGGVVRGKILNIPNQLIFDTDMSAAEKINFFVIPKELWATPQQQEIKYELSFMAVNVSQVHYICYIKFNNVWCNIDDKSVSKIGQNTKEILKYMRDSPDNLSYRINLAQYKRVN